MTDENCVGRKKLHYVICTIIKHIFFVLKKSPAHINSQFMTFMITHISLVLLYYPFKDEAQTALFKVPVRTAQ